MPTEDDLRDLFASADGPNSSIHHGIDAKQVIRRSRARRLPKQIAAGAGGALVLVGVTVLGVQSLNLGGPVTTANAPMSQESSDSDSGGAAEDSAFSTKRGPAEKLNLCGGPVAEYEPNFVGLVLDVVFPATAPATAERIEGIVIMTNETTEPVTGTTTTTPAITLSQNGVTLWHTNGPTDMVATVVDLAPGASMQFPATFEPVRCEAEDETTDAFRPGLPPVGAGAYELSAALDFASDQVTETPDLWLITGPRMPITLE